MLAKERQVYILRRLQSQPFIAMSELCKELGASKSTIQRDVNVLEEEGRVHRERGGIVQKEFAATMSDITEVPVLDKMEVNLEAKKDICRKAATCIQDGDLIFIDSGTTPVHLIPYILTREVKIVTNCYFLLSRLGGCRAEVYMLGGRYVPKYEITIGPNTLEQLKEFRFDKAFIGANGFDLKLGEAYASDFEVGALKRAVMERSKHSYLLIDDSKFTRTGISTFGYTHQFKKIFVNDFPKNLKGYKNIVNASQ